MFMDTELMFSQFQEINKIIHDNNIEASYRFDYKKRLHSLTYNGIEEQTEDLETVVKQLYQIVTLEKLLRGLGVTEQIEEP